jgi:manganese transport protein
MAPSLAILATGLDPTQALVISQVVLSFGIPFALVPLLLLTANTEVMGTLANRRATTTVAGLIAALIIALNCFLLGQTLLG